MNVSSFHHRYLDDGASLEWLLANPEHGAPEEQACRAILSKVRHYWSNMQQLEVMRQAGL
jgi:hypothetical protein